MSEPTIAIIGASLAGAKAAEGARNAGFEGRIVLIGDEAHPPYERPPLSKDVLRGDKDPSVAVIHDDSFYDDNGIELLRDHVSAIDSETRTVSLAENDPLRFDAAVICTGSEPRRLPVDGADLPGVHYLRTLDDSLQIQETIRREVIDASGRLAVIGAGWIGSEVAASARQMGAEVVMIEPAAVPLAGVFGEEIGHIFEQLHLDHGVQLCLGNNVAQLRGKRRVEELVLETGDVEPVSAVVVGIGISPRIRLAEEAGLKIDNGIVTDAHLQTSAPSIFAAGDVANAFHPLYQEHIRVEHWANALNQGLAAGANVATILNNGPLEPYSRLPYFFSDQYDLGLEYVGHHLPSDDLVIRGDTQARELIAFWQRDGIVTAAMNVNIWEVVEDLKAIVTGTQRIDPERLSDPAVPLDQLHDAGSILRDE